MKKFMKKTGVFNLIGMSDEDFDEFYEFVGLRFKIGFLIMILGLKIAGLNNFREDIGSIPTEDLDNIFDNIRENVTAE